MDDPTNPIKGSIFVPDTSKAGTTRTGVASPSGVFAAEHIVENGRYLYREGQQISKGDVVRLQIVDGKPTIDPDQAPKAKPPVATDEPEAEIKTEEQTDGAVSEKSGTEGQKPRRKRGEAQKQAGRRRASSPPGSGNAGVDDGAGESGPAGGSGDDGDGDDD